MNEIFRKFTTKISYYLGTFYTFIFAILLIVIWFATGPYFKFSTNWNLFINCVTTIITFLMTFIIQNTQNRNNKELTVKIDELIKAVETANNKCIDLKDLSDQELDEMEDRIKNEKI